MTTEPEKIGELSQEEKTPSQEGLETRNEEVEQLRSDLQKMEQNLKSAQGVTKKQAQDLENLQTQYDNAVSSRDTYKALIGLVSQQTGRSEEDIEQEVQTKKPDLVKQAETLMAQQERISQQRRFAERVNSYQAKVNELGLKEDDPAYAEVFYWATRGNWSKADEKIEAVRAKQAQEPTEKKESKKVESEEEMRKRLEEDVKKKLFEEHPEWLQSEAGEPSASSKSKRDVIARYAKGEATRQEYEEATKS